MQNMYREKLWRKRGRPPELYPDASSKDASIPPDLPVPNCDCGRPAVVFQSRHPDMAARCFYTCGTFNDHEKCFFFRWIDGPDKFDPRYLVFDHWWKGTSPRERFKRWVPPPPNPPSMTEKEQNLATYRRLESPPRCDCGDRAVVCPENQQEFVCPNSAYPYGGRKCFFREWLYGPKSHWPKQGKEKKKKERKDEPVLCRCGVQAKYGLVPSELGVGYFCGHMVDYEEETRKCTWEYYDDKDEVKQEIRSSKVMGEKMRCGSQLVDSYIKSRRQKMRRFAEEIGCNSPMRVERRRWKLADEKRAQEAREMAAANAEEEMLDNLAADLCAKIGGTGKHLVDEARARYVQQKMAEVELMAEDEGDNSRLSELLALAEAGLQAEEDEDEFMSQAADQAEAAYYNRKAVVASAGPSLMEEVEEDELMSQAADVAKAAYYKRKAEEGNAGQSSTWNDGVIEDCATDDTDEELLIDYVSD